MSSAIALGPLSLPLALLLVLLSAMVSLTLGKRLSGGAQAVDRSLWWALVLGLAAARLAFVYEYRALYFDAPLSILDIRDGGWNATAGLLATWAYGLYRERGAVAMRRPLRWALGAGTAVYFVGSIALAVTAQPGPPLPAVAFTSLEGTSVSLDGFRGRPTVVNLWATWCPPCAREMPVLLDAQRKRADVHFVFLNQGEDAAQVQRWLNRNGLPLRNVLLDPRRQAGAMFHQQGYPTTLFFDARGELGATRVGELSAATLQQKLQDLTLPP
ncbi:MAG: redoxin family protein [Roseateles sp.]|uniref:redoxin family protein n=1 Tax=Roseateles sp. TaxID=1971397 RepID=UPI0040361A59